MPVLTSPAKVILAYPNAHYKVGSDQFRRTSCLRSLGALSGFSQILLNKTLTLIQKTVGKVWALVARILVVGIQKKFRWQTVERDMFAMANELRQELNQLRKAIYDLSKGIVLPGLA
jgi:hypothetical protein